MLGVFDCRARCRASGGGSALDGGAAAVAFDIHLEDGCVMHEAIDGGQCHSGIWEDFSPFSKRLISRNQGGAPFVSRADQFEEHGGFGLVLGDVGDVIKDQQMILVEFSDGAFEGKVSPGQLQLLDEIGGACEQYTPAILDQGKADRRGEMAFAAARRAEQDQIGTFFVSGGPAPYELGKVTVSAGRSSARA